MFHANKITTNPLRLLKPHTFIREFPGYTIYAEEVNDNWLNGIYVWELSKNKEVTLLLKSKKGSFQFDQEDNNILLNLQNGEGERRNNHEPTNFSHPLASIFFEKLEIKLPIEEIHGVHKGRHKKLGYMNLFELMKAKKDGYHLPPHPDKESLFKNRIIIQLEIQKNIVMSFSVIALAFIAMPLGIRVHRKETSANLALALVLGLAYYFIVIMMGWLESCPHLRPDILIWLPHVVFQGGGMLLLRK